MPLLNLPAIPPELKSVTPYLQRADELKNQDPVIAYWCAYYAAQLGIALKVKDHASRTFLFDLLGLLERMKTDLGQNDAVHDEAASAAYVENFAIRVFTMADVEDRKGNATRATAKKFLAAANFLEVLSTFDKPASEDGAATTINVAEKIRYAKWKAADIAKAIREGRKPTPGAADEVQPEPEQAPAPAEEIVQPTAPYDADEQRAPPPPSIDLPPSTPPRPSHISAAPTSPGAWSTSAAIGTPGGPLKAWVSDELEGRADDQDDGEGGSGSGSGSGGGGRQVRFAPDVVGGRTPSAVHHAHSKEPDPFASAVPPPSAPEQPAPDEDLDLLSRPGAPALDLHLPSPPTSFEPEPTLPDVPESDPDLPSPPTFPTSQPPPSFPAERPPAPLSPPPSVPFFPSAPPPPPPTYISPPPAAPPILPPPVQPAYRQPAPVARAPPVVESTVTPTIEDLSPQTVARVQKHCRYAISALDYEDVDQARKELRTALQMLGG